MNVEIAFSIGHANKGMRGRNSGDEYRLCSASRFVLPPPADKIPFVKDVFSAQLE